MNFDLSPYGKILNNLVYADKLNVLRDINDLNEYGATIFIENKLVYENIPCKISFENKDVAGDSNEVNIVMSRKITIFTSLDHKILPGDRLECYRNDELLVSGICNEPNTFQTHQEIELLEKGYN